VNKSFNLGLNVLTERATTWLLPADEQIPQWIKGQHTQVAVRVTNHPYVQLCVMPLMVLLFRPVQILQV
jgi:tRNA A37 threonylcarbamoyladenosine synthetase subunit TsaC/SUA5/YrdC